MKKKLLNICAGAFFALGILVQISGIGNIPDTINISYGQSKVLSIGKALSLRPESESVLQLSEDAFTDSWFCAHWVYWLL